MVLLRVSRGVQNNQLSHASRDSSSEHFVYQAGGSTSTLRLLPDLRYHLELPGILRLRGEGRCGDGFLVAAINVMRGPKGDYRPLFNLHLFDSRTWTWTWTVMSVHEPERFFYFRPSKVLAIGGERGSMAWVDLKKGILVCDLLAVHEHGAMLRSIPLPPPAGVLDWDWDMAIVQGRVKFFEMQLSSKRRAITSTTDFVTKYWKATAWEKEDPCHSQQWRKVCGLDIFKVPVETRATPNCPLISKTWGSSMEANLI
ncbi:hypothetical protein ZWY2020_036584 [Hordeum vulgare]|nr:hypothetical protein ZWY2020_036584 [Hordeum vulgare]